MKRELNSHIFGQASGASAQSSVGQSSVGQSSFGRSISEFESAQTSTSQSEISFELKELRGQIEKIEKRIETESNQKDGQLRTLNEHYARLCENMMQKISWIEAKVKDQQSEKNDQNSVNQKMEEMVERHNQLVRNFENKMVHLSRVLSDQEMQILNSKAVLEEALHEISRLKK